MGVGKKELATSNYGCSSTRNLGKSQLGGVIFGTKSTTIKECLSKQLFGLPNQHFVYVEKIEPGLPLFLLNYTDRTLYGVFEAASHGQKNIDPYAWTSDGSQRTPYPAQVQVCVRSQRQPLTENQFKPIIADNYYTGNHFWFELDHAQTNRLLSLFSSQPVSASLTKAAPHCSMKWRVLPSVSKSDEKVENELVQSNRKGTSNGVKSSLNKEKDVCKSFNGNTDQSLDDCLGTSGKGEKELVYMKLKELALNYKFLDPPAGLEDDTAIVNGLTLEARKMADPLFAGHEDSNAVENEMTLESNASSKEVVVHDEKKEDSLAESSEGPIIAQLIEKVEDLMAFKTEQNRKIGCLEKKMVSLEQNLVEAENEIRNLKGHCIMLESMLGPPEEFDNTNGRKSPSEFHLDNSPERSEFHLDSSPERSDIHLDSDDLILLVGGYDGRSWFSSLDCYSPSQNQTKSLKPMNTARCYAPVSILDGELYVFGGGTGGVWYDTAESYDPVVNQWTTRPPLNARKGSLAGATVNDKIYAVGGGSGNEFYSAVEMLDLDVGAWIPTRSMLQKRFSLAAAELNGALYAVGGYDGKNYLKSAERFDPREHSWTRIESMNTVRGCPCLVVLNEKLYVLGGFDGDAMLPTVEIYDPRRGSWVIGEPMNYPRGFSAAAAAKESIYIFGGLKTGEEINDTVECYKEGEGWKITDTKAAGWRCFLSAAAL